MTVITQGTFAGDINIPFVCDRCGNANHHYQTAKIRFAEHAEMTQLLILNCEVCQYHKEASLQIKFNKTSKE